MKSLVFFATRILSVRFALILLSLAQTTLWAAALGMDAFGMASTYISAQAFASLVGRFGTDNLLVRQFDRDPGFRARFPAFLLAVAAGSLAAGSAGLVLLSLVVFRAPQGLESLVFIPLVLGVNLSLVLSRILMAQDRLMLSSVLGSVVPLTVSVGLFAAAAPWMERWGLSGHVIALALVAIGHLVAALAMVVALRPFLADCLCQWRRAPRNGRSRFGKEQWYFLGYQSIGMARSQGVTLALAAIFGPAVTGVFALASRFGGLLSYLNEPARMYVMPRIVGRSIAEVGRLYYAMLRLNALLGFAGIAVLIALYGLVTLPFDTRPPFPLYTAIIMGGAAVNLFVGPVGAILAMNGNERSNFGANLWGFLVTALSVILSAALRDPLIAVAGVAASGIVTNLVNVASLLHVMHGSRSRQAIQ